MKKIILALPAMAVISTGALAGGIDAAPYISAKGGVSVATWDNAAMSPNGFSMLGAFGARIKTDAVNMRGEFEFSFSNLSDTKNNDFWPFFLETIDNNHKTQAYLANFYVDFLEEYRLKPYIGLGLGMVRIKETVGINYFEPGMFTSEYYQFSGSDSGLGWALHGGFSFNFTDGLQGDVGARYMLTNVGEDVSMFTASAGLRYTF